MPLDRTAPKALGQKARPFRKWSWSDEKVGAKAIYSHRTGDAPLVCVYELALVKVSFPLPITAQPLPSIFSTILPALAARRSLQVACGCTDNQTVAIDNTQIDSLYLSSSPDRTEQMTTNGRDRIPMAKYTVPNQVAKTSRFTCAGERKGI